MPSLPQVHALGANKTGLPGLILSYASCRGLWIPQQGWDDLSPYANNGSATDVTYSGTAPFARMPVVPGVFNGTSSLVNVTDHASLQFTTAMTAIIWRSGVPANNSTLFGRYDTGANKRSWRMTNDNTTSTFAVGLSDNGTNIRKSYQSTGGTFGTGYSQYAFTWGDSTLTLYQNGAALAVTKYIDEAMSAISNAGTPPTQIGCSNNSGTPFLFASGNVACAAVFNAALTAADIQAMYLVGANGP